MVPKIHARGKSFKGAAAYLLHDKDRAETRERVAWTETRNMATSKPDMAWKVMAATAMDQQRLKAKANVKATGRKSTDSVLHISLAWHQRHAGTLSRDEMRRAVIGALKAINADDRQALIICHSDEPHPHVHILVNRVSPVDGRMLSSSKEKLALSKWAEDYERQTGQIECPERAINNAARERGEYTRGKKDQARHLYESDQHHQMDTKAKQGVRTKEASFSKSVRERRKKDKEAWKDIRLQHRERQAKIRSDAKHQMEAQKNEIRQRNRPAWTDLFHRQEEQKKAFLEREKSLLGRVHNALRAMDFKAIMRGEVSAEGKTRRQALGEAFDALSKAGARLDSLKREQAKESRIFATSQKREEREAAKRIREERDAAIKQNAIRFVEERNDLIFTQQMEGAKLRAERTTFNQQRDQAWHESRAVSLTAETSQATALSAFDAFRERMHGPEKEPDKER
jgi:hypothetical protein